MGVGAGDSRPNKRSGNIWENMLFYASSRELSSEIQNFPKQGGAAPLQPPFSVNNLAHPHPPFQRLDPPLLEWAILKLIPPA